MNRSKFVTTKPELNSSSLFVTVLALIFITLKLTGVITWPWLAVLAPLWIPFVLAALVMVLVLIGFGVFCTFTKS